ncbi:MAG: PQQ-binding-like beta-propeller repeat protein [Planctomycetota bacterium]
MTTNDRANETLFLRLASSLGGGRSLMQAAVVLLVVMTTWQLQADDRDRSALDRVHRRRVSNSAVRAIGEKFANDVEKLRLGQAVLDQESDAFFDDLTSIRRSVESRLRRSPDDVTRKYDSLFAAESKNLYAAAVSESSIPKLRRITNRFFMTESGYLASEQLIAHWLDSGDYPLAGNLARQVLAEPVHERRITPQFRKMLVLLKAATGIEFVAAGTDSDSVIQFQRRFGTFRDSLNPLESGWMMHGGSSSGSRIVGGSPVIPIPAWKADLFANQSSRSVQDFLKDWEGSRKEDDEPCCPATYPIVVDRSVIFRDANGLRSVDVTTGKLNWSFACNYRTSRTEAPRRLIRTRGFQGNSVQPSGSNSLGENTLMGMISSDGQRVYAIDTSSVSETDEELNALTPVHPFRNRLVAVRAQADAQAGKIAWINEGVIPPRMRSPGGPQRFSFLGAPLPGISELLCITEHDIEVHLTALDPQSGEMIWTQPLCSVERTELADPERHEIACLPMRSDGIVVCPTNTGLLVGVDQARMNLLWAAFVDDLPDAKRGQFRGVMISPSQGYAGYGSQVLIAGGRVVYVPLHCSQIQCLELATGRVVWSVPRNGAEFIGAVSDGRVLVVGRQRCRGLKLTDGSEIWDVGAGMPAGRGVAIGDRYALPLDAGRLAWLDMATGRDHGTKALQSDVALGHLVADRDRVYSLSSRGLAALPQVDYVMREINAAGSKVASGVHRDIAFAEIAMVQGNLAEGERRLRLLLTGELTSLDRERSRRELKELLFQKIEGRSDSVASELELLEPLLESPEDQFRFLIAASAQQGAMPRWLIPEQVADRIYNLPERIAGALPGDEEWKVSPAAWCRLQMKISPAEGFGERLQQLRQLRSPPMRVDANSGEVLRYVRVFNSDSAVIPPRSFLASQLTNVRSVHAGEMLWLRNSIDGEPHVAAEAALRLMELWEENGFVADAAGQLDLLATKFADVQLPAGMIGREVVKQLREERVAKIAWRKSREPRWAVQRVEIDQAAARPDFAQPLTPLRNAQDELVRYQSDRMGTVIQGRTARYAWQPIEFVLSPSEIADQSTLTIFDQRTHSRLGLLNIPLTNRFPGVDKVVTSGHLIPLGLPGGLVGISTMQLGDAEPVWKQMPSEMSGRRSPVNPGPASPDFASFSWRNLVYVVDPLDGTLLWQRKIAVPSQELNPNFRLELIGDRQVIGVQRVVDSGDGMPRVHYEVFETATGRRLPTVKPGYISGQWRGSYGRHIVGVVDNKGTRVLEIRDLLSDKVEITEALPDTRLPVFVPGGEMIYVGSGGEVRIYDVGRCQKKLSAQLDGAEVQQIRAVQMFSDRSRYFVNIRRHTATATTTQNFQPISGQHVPGLAVGDDLYAFDRATGELLWKRSIPYRTVLQFQDCPLPFLVMLSQVNDRTNSALQSLAVEVIDSSTGVTVGYRDHLKYDQIIEAQYDGEEGRIHLRGQQSDIELKFGPNDASPAASAMQDAHDRRGTADYRRGSAVRRGSPDPAEPPDRRSPLHSHPVRQNQ